MLVDLTRFPCTWNHSRVLLLFLLSRAGLIRVGIQLGPSTLTAEFAGLCNQH